MAKTAPLLPYAVIRENHYLRHDDEQPPAYVLLVEKETDASLMGSILAEAGERANWCRAFDTQPTEKRTGYGSSAKWETTRPGRIRKERLFSRHESFDAANAALALARAAWSSSEDRGAERAASRAFLEATDRFNTEKKRLEAEMQHKLAGLQAELDAAKVGMHRARAEMHAKQSAAALEAATALAPSLSGRN